PVSVNASAPPPPIAVVSALTVMPVLVGFAAGITVTVKVTLLPWAVGLGFTATLPVGLLGGVHGLRGEEVFRGVGVIASKSALLTFVSWHPAFLRVSAVAVLGAGALLPPSLQFAVVPYPTRSAMFTPLGHALVRAVVFL